MRDEPKREAERDGAQGGKDVDRDFSSMQKKRRDAMRRDTPALNCPLVTQRRTDGRAHGRKRTDGAAAPSRSLNP